jgi:hypothetical protein
MPGPFSVVAFQLLSMLDGKRFESRFDAALKRPRLLGSVQIPGSVLL